MQQVNPGRTEKHHVYSSMAGWDYLLEETGEEREKEEGEIDPAGTRKVKTPNSVFGAPASGGPAVFGRKGREREKGSGK